jgi:hypothetical protein
MTKSLLVLAAISGSFETKVQDQVQSGSWHVTRKR